MPAMPNAAEKQLLARARESLARPLTFNDFLAKLSPKDRATAERRVSALEAEQNPAHAKLWQRLASVLMTLAPHAAKLVGRQTLQLYVADGKYRMQVFALEDLQDGNFTVYGPDVLDEAIKLGVLKPPTGDPESHQYAVQPSKEPLHVERLDSGAMNPAPHVKDLTGWNRKAIKVVIPPAPSSAQVEAAELLCALAAQHFAPAAAPAAGASVKKN